MKVAHLSCADMAARAGRVPGLDGLRAVAIMLVLGAHLIDDRWFPGGFGVLVFFVISGFLITRLLLAELKARRTISLGAFYLRRIVRLYPAVLVYTALVILVFALAAPGKLDWREPISALFYFANYLFAHYSVAHITVTMPFTHFWSLSIEEQFYIVFPALLLLVRGRPGAVVALAVVACLVPLALRLVAAIDHPGLLGTEYFYLRTELRLDAIAFGVLIAGLCELPKGRALLQWLIGPAPVAVALALLIFCFADRAPFFRETWRYTLLAGTIAIGLSAVMFSGRYAPLNWLLNTAPLTWIGRLSYSLYVWHLAVAEAVRYEFAGRPHLAVAAVALVATFAAAALSYYGLELPLTGLRRRLGSRAGRPPLWPAPERDQAAA
ncbi:MAG: acyltransferase family protein [Stellaceae bacterium]